MMMCTLTLSSLAGCSNKPEEITTTQIEITSEDVKLEEIYDKPEAFDLDVKNNSLAVSPDESIAIVFNSTIPEIKVYDLKDKK